MSDSAWAVRNHVPASELPLFPSFLKWVVSVSECETPSSLPLFKVFFSAALTLIPVQSGICAIQFLSGSVGCQAFFKSISAILKYSNYYKFVVYSERQRLYKEHITVSTRDCF